MPQITARLSPEIRDRFEKYASEMHLDASELARILIVRAMRRRKPLRLTGLGPQEVHLGPVRQRKLTAHFHGAASVSEFDSYAAANGLRRAPAAKLIFERELQEMWLKRALSWAPKMHRERTSS